MCGVFGICAARGVDVANITYFGMFALQHRGQESAGIAVSDGQSVRVHRGMGLVAQVFSPATIKDMGEGSVIALGHTRYSTTGSSRPENAHPLPFHHPQLGSGAIAHNGNLLNAGSLRKQLEEDGATFDTALDTDNATFVREVQPGEMVVMDEHGVQSLSFQTSSKHAMCVFEFIYFARPDSILKNCELEEARIRMGNELAKEAPVDADMVIAFPDSGTPAAIGYAEAAGIPFREALMKSRYINRTFIEPDQSLREAGVMLKLNALPRSIKGKRVIAVDDSIVRGTTSRRIIEHLRGAGASEIHMRISSPPMRFPCFMGVDIGSTKELIAAGRTVDQVRGHIGADSLAYLSIPGLMRAIGRGTSEQFCRACFDGSYPVPVPQQLTMDKMQFETTFIPDPVLLHPKS